MTPEPSVTRKRIAEISAECAKENRGGDYAASYPAREAIRDLLAAIDERDAALKACVEAMEDTASGLRYVRETHGYPYGVGFDRVQSKIDAALALARGFTEGT